MTATSPFFKLKAIKVKKGKSAQNKAYGIRYFQIAFSQANRDGTTVFFRRLFIREVDYLFHC
jgi:hypothetical protein